MPCRDARRSKDVSRGTIALRHAFIPPPLAQAGRRIGFRDFLRALSLIAESKGVPGMRLMVW